MNYKNAPLFLLVILIMLQGCSQFQAYFQKRSKVQTQTEKKNDGVKGINEIISNYRSQDTSSLNVENPTLSKKVQNPDEIDGNIKTADSNDESDTADESSLATVDLGINSSVEMWIKYFSQKDKERFQRMLDRGQQYRPIVENILEENGLPKELFYLAMIESGFVTHAKSRAKAVGVWQFIKGTGSRYGLAIDSYVDERRDPIRATEAAAKYLRGLYEVFQSWELALAAYNCGEYRVLSAIMKGGTRDFWLLSEKNLLPRETQNYVPKFRASIIVGENIEKYGMAPPTAESDYPDLESVTVPSPVSIKSIAATLGMNESEIKRYNPHLHRGMTPPRFSKYEIWVPANKAETLIEASSKLLRLNVALSKSSEDYEDKQYYKVRRGDSLLRIARKFKQSVRHIVSVNNLRSTRIFAGQRLRISTKSYRSNIGRVHVVRRGENLGSIANKYHLSLGALKRMNNMAGSKIYPGQKLKIMGKGAEILAASHSSYRVKRGDNLYSIARRFNTSVSALKEQNNLDRSRIFIGQTLMLPL